MTTFDSDITINGDLRVTGTARFVTTAGVKRADLTQDTLKAFTIPLESWKVFDALQTNLPGTAASDDLGLIGGTHGSASPSIQTSDAKTTTVTQKMRASIPVPAEYQAGETLVLRIHAGMLTTTGDGTATVDVLAYKSNEEAGVGSDLCATAAQSIKSLTLADKDFTITATSLSPGDLLDVLVVIAITDTATGTAVKGIIGSTKLLADVQG
jgi:hypothetical protein